MTDTSLIENPFTLFMLMISASIFAMGFWILLAIVLAELGYGEYCFP